MNKKEKMELLLTKVPEEKKEAFIAELREAKTKEARGELFKKYGISLTEEEKAALKEMPSNMVTDEELDEAAGGCCGNCHLCNCYFYCA